MGDLQRGLDSYNEIMLDMCKERNAECLDLASALPKDKSVFYDDVHFTEVGARLVAEEIATYLLSKPPFQRSSGGSALLPRTEE